MRQLVLLTVLILAVPVLNGQVSSTWPNGGIPTSVPFLTLAPDARAAGMGDVGVASAPDVNSQYWNAAKYVFTEAKGGLSLTYAPWYRNLISGIYLASAAGYYKINPKHTVSASVRYFSLGEVLFTTSTGTQISFHPFEMALDAAYSRSFGERLSGGLVFRYIHSDLVPRSGITGSTGNKVGTSLAGDLGIYYQSSFFTKEREMLWALGLNLSNVGSPVSYSTDAEGTPIPTNLRVGAWIQYPVNAQHSLSLQCDLNKLLVPTPPVYDIDTVTGEQILHRGKAQPESVLAGMLQSFYDAPGVQKSNGSYSVLLEELYEIMYSLGLEYRYKNRVALRTGYFHQHSSKGNQKYVTIGIGGSIQKFSLDLSYLFPTSGQNHPLANTFRVMLTAEFGRSGI